jgi:hypothetical protein
MEKLSFPAGAGMNRAELSPAVLVSSVPRRRGDEPVTVLAYAREEAGQGCGEDVSMLKVNEINNWMRAWIFMERCGLKAGQTLDDDLADNDTGDFN